MTPEKKNSYGRATDEPLLSQDIPDSVWNISNDFESWTIGEDATSNQPSFEELACAIETAMRQARTIAAYHVNNSQLRAYWSIGRMIVVYEQAGRDRAEYGEETLTRLSKRLTATLGRGFSRANLYNMRQFYLTHQSFQTVSGKLFWSHYCELLSVADEAKRCFYEREASNAGWSVRELRRQMDSMLFERVLNAKSDVRKDHVMALAKEGVSYQQPIDALKSPVVLEFVNLPDFSIPQESDLQKALLRQIEKFMLELGRGFMFVGSNVRIPVGSDKDYADMVFYCKPLRAYVIIELKTTKFMASAVGQINEYLNYYAAEINDEFDNPPIGIILCTDKNNVRAEYALGGLSNAIFASTYTLRLPDKDQLEEQVRKTIEANERRLLSGANGQ